ncbi:MAG TPA: hypothetical protein DCL66_00130 [Gammaproteobacteria bacterium]|nr:hypothetical protein [Gammaproteobacteria bacterium]
MLRFSQALVLWQFEHIKKTFSAIKTRMIMLLSLEKIYPPSLFVVVLTWILKLLSKNRMSSNFSAQTMNRVNINQPSEPAGEYPAK